MKINSMKHKFSTLIIALMSSFKAKFLMIFEILDNLNSFKSWVENEMPKYERTFEVKWKFVSFHYQHIEIAERQISIIKKLD